MITQTLLLVDSLYLHLFTVEYHMLSFPINVPLSDYMVIPTVKVRW